MPNGDAPTLNAVEPTKSIHASMGFTHPIHEERPMRVVTIGAGASGLLMAYKLQRNFAKFEHVIYEKNPDLGGTWFENRYPGYTQRFIFVPKTY